MVRPRGAGQPHGTEGAPGNRAALTEVTCRQQRVGAAMGLVNGASDRAGAYLVLSEAAPYVQGRPGPSVPGQEFWEICCDISTIITDLSQTYS